MASHSEITQIAGGTGAAVDHGHAEIAQISGGVVGASLHGHAEIVGISGRAGAFVGSHAEITGISGGTAIPTDLQARAGLDRQVSAIAPTFLDGSASTGAWVATSWSVASDSRVPLSAPYSTTLDPIDLSSETDPSVTINFPAYPQNYTVNMMLTITDGVTTSSDTIAVKVWSWNSWRITAGGLEPRIDYRLWAT